MSDGDAFNHKSLSPNSPHYQAHSPPSQSSIDDGYLSEGGASFYAKKIQNRIAIEKQKTVEEQNRKLEEFSSKRPLPGLPDVLGNSEMTGGGNSNPIYRVVGGRNKPKSEAGMQTESNMTIKQSVQEHYDWKQVCAIVLSVSNRNRFFFGKMSDVNIVSLLLSLRLLAILFLSQRSIVSKVTFFSII